MYGTVARIRVKPEQREAMRELNEQQDVGSISGYVSSHVLWEDGGGDGGWLFVVFDDRDSYHRNANDPAQHARYKAWRALMEADPEWHDGQIETG